MIKLIATDMDGTWLRPDKSYDQILFQKIFKLMQEQDIKFVVASSNQYENLRQRFSKVADQIYYIAENGGLIAAGKQVLQTKTLTSAETAEAAKVAEHYNYPLVWCGVKSAYILQQEGPAYYQEMKQFFEKLTAVEQFDLKQDRFF
jgi:sugar-phosphatase